MVVKKYKVTKDIIGGWEGNAYKGEVLEAHTWNSFLTLMKGEKAICDIDSEFTKENCIPVE